MNSLAVLLLLLIEDRIFVLGHHLLLPGHLSIPSLHSLGCQTAIPLQRCADSVHHTVDGTETLALSRLLRTGEPPWDFPIQERLMFMVFRFGIRRFGALKSDWGKTSRGDRGRKKTYQRRPPNSGDVGLNIMRAGRTGGRGRQAWTCSVKLIQGSFFSRLAALRMFRSSRVGPCALGLRGRFFSS